MSRNKEGREISERDREERKIRWRRSLIFIGTISTILLTILPPLYLHSLHISPSLSFTLAFNVHLSCSGNPEEQEEGGAVYEVLDSRGRPIPKGEEVESGIVTISFGRSACPSKTLCLTQTQFLLISNHPIH